MNKFTALAIIEAVATNPNGDPGNMNMPRMLGDNGFISAVSLKRHWRDLSVLGHPAIDNVITELGLDQKEYRISTNRDTEVTALTKELQDYSNKGQMPFVDVRLFGAMNAASVKGNETEEKPKKGQKKETVRYIETGVVVIDQGLSVHPVETVAPTIGRIYGAEDDKERALGTLPMVKYGVYAIPIHFNNSEQLLKASLTRPEDIEYFKRTFPYVIDVRSSSRSLNLLNFYWYDHSKKRGDIADFRLIDALMPKPLVDMPSCREEITFADIESVASKLPGKLVDLVNETVLELVEMYPEVPLARSADTERGIPQQSYYDHVCSPHGVVSLATQFAKETTRHTHHQNTPFVETVRAAAYYHDLGKLYAENQKALAAEGHARLPIRHEAAGTAVLRRTSPLAALLVESHHAYLDNLRSDKFSPVNDGLLLARNSKGCDGLLPIHERLANGPIDLPAPWTVHPTPFDIRMMLSCLVDGDHSQVARYSRSEGLYRLPDKRWKDRLAQLDRHVSSLPRNWKNEYQKERQRLRDVNYDACRSASVDLGITNLNAPVGTGKTYGYLAHGLNVASVNDSDRLFVVLPLTAVLDQVGEECEKLILPGERKNRVLAVVHHTADFESTWLRKYSATFQPRIVLTTSVNFFETMAGRTCGAVRKLHRYANSVIVIDESHLSLHMVQWRMAWHWLGLLVRDYNCHVVLSSGTEIPFWEFPNVVKDNRPLYGLINHKDVRTVRPLVPQEKADTLRQIEKDRVRIIPALGYWNLQALSQFVIEVRGPTCVVVNTIRSAARIADFFSKSTNKTVLHISTALAPIDRRKQLSLMNSLLEREADFITVGTSAIETGLDVSFRRGFRERAGLWPILQLSGRVNRNFEYGPKAIIQEFILDTSEDELLTENPLVAVDIEALRRLLVAGYPLSIGSCKEYTRLLLREIRSRANGNSAFTAYLNMRAAEDRYNFDDVAKFQVISASEVTAIVYDDIVEKIRKGVRLPMRTIMDHSVRVDQSKADAFGIPLGRIFSDEEIQHMKKPGKLLPNLHFIPSAYYDAIFGYLSTIVNANQEQSLII